jgi:hypothetical protein
LSGLYPDGQPIENNLCQFCGAIFCKGYAEFTQRQ